MEEWFLMLVQARTRLGLSQASLAARAHVSLASVKAYEQGKRHPSQPYLTALLDALKIERSERGEILEAAGYASDWHQLVPSLSDLGFTLEQASEEVERLPWPSFVLNEMSEVIVANQAVQRLWGVDLRREFTEVAERNLLAVASAPRFAERIANWDEAVGALVAVFKGHHRGAESVENPSPYFKSVMDRFLAGDARYVARFLQLWQEVPPAEIQLRWHYPIVWQDPLAGRMTFDCVVSNANIRQGWAFNDWMPVGAGTWAALQRLLEGPQRG
ncbi:MAG: helix-turn-helix domain-containing protein [Chloroflexi bacterium]|nr:helix-turn-helix domain-containing protein [Chloroflexota bacterium]